MNESVLRTVLAKDADWAQRRKLAILCRIAGQHGLIGLFGHISIRIPDSDLVLITPGAGAEKTTVRADQIFVFDLAGKILHHPGGDFPITIPAEYRIHTQIHRDRPEILCVAHLHAPHSTLLGVVNRPIVPVFNQAFMFGAGVPTWDDPRLVLSDAMATDLSKALGDKLACQMRGHGSVVVGETPEIALMNCMAIEENARLQIAAEPFGGAVPFPRAMIEDAMRLRGMVQVTKVVWEYYERKVVMDGVPL
ncbi:MAG TPA: class II aldolase/adducin family protein [Stellaceae bacterium]|nr:class II aldolase/adducin family protein [Stellaceae bacterium]